MQITDRTRKVLWGRCGNRCAICKHELVVDATRNDDESIVADECHIISPRPTGPRHDSSFPAEKLDAYENLILLCRTHHKMVDDQTATFTTDILRQFKTNHEVWVSQQLTGSQKPQPVRLRRVKENVPSFLSRLTTGKEVLDVVTNAMSCSFDHDELRSQEEVAVIGAFLQVAQDWGDLSADLEAGELVQIAYDLTKSLQSVEDAGFCAFGGREVQILTGGDQSSPSSWPVAIIRVLRKDNPGIARIAADELNATKAQPRSGAGR